MSLNGCLGPTKRGGWRGVGRKGWQRVGERLARGWRRVGKGLAKGWRRVGEGLADFLAPSNFGIPKAPVVTPWISESPRPCEKRSQQQKSSFFGHAQREKHCKNSDFEGRRCNFGTCVFCWLRFSWGQGGSEHEIIVNYAKSRQLTLSYGKLPCKRDKNQRV